ncbi:MAG: hypothetical protein ABH824_06450 [Nanoarchaeota archaeon]|nr:hypothetical protein [Nanoarchaeota archaeon]MBU1631917.1 hypothetical protein [Nanoarchaeota archaeon]MBU1876126.1 hypothetical protein [Nanoarchaeota archaeon]
MKIKRGFSKSSSSWNSGSNLFKHFFASKNSKKGQVTVFIIVGILILFIFSGVLYLTKETTKEEFTAEGEPIVESVPQTFKPIQTYTENCLSKVAEQGLLVLGQQGGYIYPDLVGEYSVSDSTEADGINLEPLKVPFWHYNTNQNSKYNVVYNSLKPKLYAKDDPVMSIEAQLSRYVNEKLDGCLDDYSSFEGQGFDIEVSPIKSGKLKDVEAKVGERTVNFLLTMNIKAKKEDVESSLQKFYVKVPLELKHYYEIAEMISDAQSKDFFLETQGLEILTAYSNVDANYFPPISTIRFDHVSTLSWSEFNLKERYKELLTSYVPALRFLGSENFYYNTDDRGFLAQRIVDNMVLPLVGAEDLEVSFDYFGWTPYFKTNSDADGIIRPESLFISAFVLTYGQQRYETHYDISYPVLVTLNDAAALDGKGYKFLFALESNIRNNDPGVSGVPAETYPQRITSLACNNEQKDTEMLKTVVVDSFTKEPLEAVKIGFTIPEQAECEMGFTDEDGAFESNYPSVYGGVMNYVHEGYLSDFYPIDTYKYRDQKALIGYSVEGLSEKEKVIELHKIKSINVSVKKKNVQKCITPLSCSSVTIPFPPFIKDISCKEEKKQCFFNKGNTLLLGDPVARVVANSSMAKFHDYYFFNKALDMDETEDVFINLERVAGFHEGETSLEFNTPISIKGNSVAEVELVPGKYKVTIMSKTTKPLVIPKDRRCFAYDVMFWETEDCFDIDGNNLDKYVNGNVNWDTPETYFEITPEDLYTSNEIVFYVVTQDLSSVPLHIEVAGETIPSRVSEDMQLPGMLINVSRLPEVRAALEPKFIGAEGEES